MDSLAAAVMFNRADSDYETTNETIPQLTLAQFLLGVTLIALAAYMSWTCNVGMGTPMRLGRAVLAGGFGTVYLIWYAVSGCSGGGR